MDLLLFIGLTVLLIAPFHLAIQYHLARSVEADYLRQQGLAFPSVAAFDSVGPAIGTYSGSAIHASITFMGLDYTYDRIAPAKYRHRVKPNELFLQPGLVYVITHQ